MKNFILFLISIFCYSLFSQDCNYIEHGDFEIAKFEDDYSISPNNGTPNDSFWRFHTLDTNEINTIDLYRVANNNVVTYIRDTTVNPSPITFGTCIFNTVMLDRPPFGGNIFVGLASMKNYGGPNFPDNRESIALKLNKALRIGDSFRFSFHGRKNQSVCSNFKLYIYGSKTRPCNRPIVTKFDGTVSGCGFQAVLIDSVLIDSAKWKNYSFKFTAPDSFKYFITRMQEYFASENDPNLRYGFFDDFRLENLGVKYRLKVTSNVDTFHACRHQLSHRWDTIKFIVRLDTHTMRNSIPLSAEIHIPAAYDNVNTPIANSAYNIRNVTIPANTISRNDSFVFIVFPLNNTSANIHGEYADIIFKSSGQDHCLESTVRIPTKIFKGDENMTGRLHEFPSKICSDTITYCAHVIGGFKPFSYLWSGVGGLSTSKRDSACWTNAQVLPRYNIEVKVTDSNYCSINIRLKQSRFGEYALHNMPTFPNLWGTLDSVNEYRILDVFGPFNLNKNGQNIFNDKLVFRNCHFRLWGYYSVIDNIKVENSAKFYNCTFTSCREASWAGIQIGKSASNKVPELIMSGCTIEDAQTAISVTNGSVAVKFNIGLERNNFFNNHNGIELNPGHISVKNIDVINVLPFHGNKFDMTNTQLKEYDINTPNTVSRNPKKMIRLENVNYFNIGTHGKGRNEIFRCEKGIELVRTNATVNNFSIANTSWYNNAGDYQGKAIDANMGIRTHFFQPPGKTVNIQAKAKANHISGPSIYIGDYGIVANNIILNVSNTSFQFHKLNPVHASSAWSLSPIKLYDNHIEDFNGQAEAMYVRSYFRADIARDTVISSPDFNLNAVFLHGFNLNNNDSVLVRNNLIKNYGFPQNNARRSSFLLEAFGHSKKLNIFQNRFEMTAMDEEYDGALGIINSNNVHAYQNIILGQGAGKGNASESGFGLGAIQNPLGIYANGSTSVISCNQVHDFNTGIRYSGTNLSSTLSVNTLTDHDHGLMVDNGASINPQLHQGNMWTGSLTWGAKNENNPLVWTIQKFTVHTSNAFTGNLLWPSENTSGIWFVPDGFANDKTQCDVPPLPASNVPIKAKISVSNFNGIATIWERDIMLGGSLFANYNGSLVFQNQLQLFGVMQDRSTLILANSPEANWLHTNQTSPLGQFYSLERAIDSALTPSSAHLQQLEHYLNQRAEAMQAISSLDSLKGLDSLGVNLVVYLSQEDYHREQIREIDNTIELLEQPRIDTIYQKLDQLTAQANEIQTTALYMDYLKQMYSLQLRYLKNGGLDSSSWDTIRQIADLCPLISEKAVYMARSMMMGDTSIYYRDNQKCLGYSQKQTGTKREKQDITLFPNPVNNKIVLQFPKLYTEPLEVRIYNVMGREVWSELIIPKKLIHEINSSKFHDGLYIVKIMQQGNEISNIKIHVIH